MGGLIWMYSVFCFLFVYSICSICSFLAFWRLAFGVRPFAFLVFNFALLFSSIDYFS